MNVLDLSSDTDMLLVLILVFAVLPVAVADSHALRRIGVRVSPWWAVLVVPVYLLLRAVRARTGWHLLIVWVVNAATLLVVPI